MTGGGAGSGRRREDDIVWRLMFLAMALALAALVAACSDPDISSHRWRCTIDDDCASGHVCSNSVCVSPDTRAGDTGDQARAAAPLTGS